MKLVGDKLKQSLLHALKQSLTGHRSICVAYSGGLDSTVLLHLCDLLRTTQNQLILSAFHVHHGLSEHADDWLAHCESVASMRNITFRYAKVGIKKQAQQSLEAQARVARYKALSRYAGKEECVLLAQHQDDQAETFLLQLKRGAGTKGLSSMPRSFVDASGTQYVRPLLNFSREQLASFANTENLSWIEDESNQDQRFDRNFLRQSVLPLICDRWPQFNARVARSALHCANTQSVINEYMALIKSKVLLTDDSASIEQLNTLSVQTQAEFIRFWLAQFLSQSPSSVQVDTLLSMVQSTSSQASHLVVQDVCIERTMGCLLVTKIADKSKQIDDAVGQQTTTPVQFSWQGQSEQAISNSVKLISVDEASAKQMKNSFFMPYGDYKVDYGRMSLRAKMHDKRPSKSLKTWFQEWAVSPLRRQQIPILIKTADNNESSESVVAICRTDLIVSMGPLNENLTEDLAENLAENSTKDLVENLADTQGNNEHHNQSGPQTKILTHIASGFKSPLNGENNANSLGAWARFFA